MIWFVIWMTTGVLLLGLCRSVERPDDDEGNGQTRTLTPYQILLACLRSATGAKLGLFGGGLMCFVLAATCAVS